jgi:hypothetical protein
MKANLTSLGLLACSLVIALLLAEMTLRLLVITYPSLYMDDPDRGGQLRPGAMGWWLKEGKSYVRINSDGLRDGEHNLAKPSNVLRIAVLGDSYAEAFQVEPDQTFWAVMAKRLNRCAALSGKQVEAINFGVSGYGTASELVTLRKHVWKYHVDLVLLAFLTGNDFSDNFPIRSQNPSRPHATLKNGKLVFHSFVGVPLSRTARFLLDTGLMDRSYLVQTLYHTWRQLRDRSTTAVAPHNTQRVTQATRKAVFEFGLDDWIYSPPVTPDQKTAWLVTEALIRQMNREVTAGGAHFFLATLSNGIQVNPDRDARKAFMREMHVSDLLYPDRRIAALAKTEGIQHLMLVPVLQSWAETHHTCVHGFANGLPCEGHWNEHGHREAGVRMADAVCAMLGQH